MASGVELRQHRRAGLQLMGVMMPQEFICEACGHRMSIPDHYAGRSLFCTSCKKPFTAPDPSPAPVLPEGDGGVACPTCGKLSPTGSSYCSSCGGSFLPHAADIHPMQRPALISVIAVLDILGGCLVLVAGAALLLTAREEPAIAFGLGAAYLLLGAVQLATGIGLWQLKPWARTAQIALSVIGLLGFPIGTIISLLVLYYLFRPGVKVLFSGKAPAELTPDDRAALATVSKSGGLAIVVVAVAVVFGCGLVSAIAIPNLLNAINRGRQKRTVVDMQTVAAAVERYHRDNRSYPSDVGSIDELARVLEPAYLARCPTVDGWSHPFVVQTDATGSVFRLLSCGRDTVEGQIAGGPTRDFDDDIVLENGEFVQWPEGVLPQ